MEEGRDEGRMWCGGRDEGREDGREAIRTDGIFLSARLSFFNPYERRKRTETKKDEAKPILGLGI